MLSRRLQGGSFYFLILLGAPSNCSGTFDGWKITDDFLGGTCVTSATSYIPPRVCVYGSCLQSNLVFCACVNPSPVRVRVLDSLVMTDVFASI